MDKYELIVIGSGPAGEKGAVKAAYFGRSVALIEKEIVFGGAGVYTGTLPSKTLKETALYISGKYEKGLYGIERALKRSATVDDFLFRKNFVCAAAGKEVHDNLLRHGVKIYHGEASFIDAHTLSFGKEQIQGDFILIATGSYPYHPPEIPFDGQTIVDSDTILEIQEFPKSLCIVGAGVIGCEYASIFATMGTKVFLVNDKDQILPHVDGEVSRELVVQMEKAGVEIVFNASLKSVQKGESVETLLSSGRKLTTDMFLFAAGRSGRIQGLNLEAIGVKTGKRGAIEVNSAYQTSIPHIFAAGDVIGFPALASTSMEQARIAVAHMFHTADLSHLSTIVPYGIYTVPEVSMVGMTEEEAKESRTPYAVGKARFADLARGRIMGATAGFLKLVFHNETLSLLGVHIIGPAASELIHYGLLALKDQKDLYDLIGEVFNFPTLHDLYKYAAYDGLGTTAGHKVK
jgi:NAD(P) transhydrogenase